MGNKLNKIEVMTVQVTSSIKQTMRAIDTAALGIAFIVDRQNKLCGVATDGDIRRAILAGINIDETPIERIMNKNPITISSGWSTEYIKKYLYDKEVISKLSEYSPMKIPVLDHDDCIVDIIYASKEKRDRDKQQIVLVEREPVEIKQVNSVLVIGGAGYLGAVLCRKLLENGYKVRVLDSLMYGDTGIRDLYTNPEFELIEGDSRNLQVVMQCLRGIDAVIHLAAIVGDPASALNPQEAIEINYLSTKLITEACKFYQVNRFIFASTCSVYGLSTTPGERLSEESALNPVSLYASMKLNSEKGIMELLDENFSPTILRMATLYGLSPRMRFDLIVNLLSAKATVDGEITIFGGTQWRPNLHVKDAADAFMKCLTEPIDKIKGQIFNVGSNEQNYQVKVIGEIIQKIIPGAKLLTYREKVDQRSYDVSFDKITKTLNYKIKHTVEDAVREITESIKEKEILDYTYEGYSNYKYLSEQEN